MNEVEHAGPDKPKEAHVDDDVGFALPEPMKISAAKLTLTALVVAAAIGGAFAVGYIPRWKARQALETETRGQGDTKLKVDVIKPTLLTSDHQLTLPATLEPLEQADIHARTNGYVKRWLVDIGDKVKEGDLLAEIDTPEVDQDLAQARAQLGQVMAALAQANANLDLAKTNYDRAKKLTEGGVNTQQDVDQKEAQVKVEEANVAAARANVGASEAAVKRATDLQSFAKLVSPLTGTVTARSIERGNLVSATGGAALYTIATLDPMRVLVGVPQDVAPATAVHTPATVTVREYAGVKFKGEIARTAGALDQATRTMATEIRVPNPDGKLLAGMYAEVSMDLSTSHKVYEVPATAIYSDGNGVRVAIVDDSNIAHFVTVTIERDMGPTVEISTGLDGSERVVKLATAALSDGDVVEVVAPQDDAEKK